jgi:hypothetical protein
VKRGLMFVLKYELRLWEALFRWAFRRPHRVEPGTVVSARRRRLETEGRMADSGPGVPGGRITAARRVDA